MNLHSRVTPILLLVTTQAVAATDQKLQESQGHSEKAQLLYDMGHWGEAITEYEVAYASSKDPILLYKMAETCRRKGDTQRAVDLYKNFREKVPDSPLRPEVDEKIAVLEAQINAAKTPAAPVSPIAIGAEVPTPTPPVSPTPPTPGTAPAVAAPSPQAVPVVLAAPPSQNPTVANSASINSAWPTAQQPSESTTSGTRILGAVLMGVGAAGIGAGAYFSWRTESMESKVTGSAVYNQAEYDSGRQAALVQWVCYGAGAGLALTGLILYVVGGTKPQYQEQHVSLVPSIWSDTAGLSAQGAF